MAIYIHTGKYIYFFFEIFMYIYVYIYIYWEPIETGSLSIFSIVLRLHISL